jgi:hypothetical protein
MYGIVLAGVFAGTLFFATGQNVGPIAEFKIGPAPALPFYDWNVCPGEGCAYGRWTARKPVLVYDTLKAKRRVLARLRAGEKVIGVTGVVITFRPGVIRMSRELPNEQLKGGDTILTYAYRGEGESAVWFNGRYYPDFDIGFTKLPDGDWCQGESCAATFVDMGKKVWWAEVKLKSGLIGWVDMDRADFAGVCLLEAPSAMCGIPALNVQSHH